MSKGRRKSGKKWLIAILILIVIGCVFGNTDNDNTETTGIPSSTSTTVIQSITDVSEEATKQQTTTTTTTTAALTTTTTKPPQTTEKKNTVLTVKPSYPKGFKSVPKYSGKDYVAVNNNLPFFTEADYTTKSYEYYSDLDSKGRCGFCMACIGVDLMPTEKRGEIGQVKPTGWHTVKYDCVDGKYLYNRSHLIGYQLSGENANVRNLITGTRYFNVSIMLPFENMVADYVKETNNHVMYRVTPVFEGNNLLATGVLMEGWSVEDSGDGICFNVFCFNVQPGVSIDYATGESWIEGKDSSNTTTTQKQVTTTESQTNSAVSNNKDTYILNLNTKKFHYTYCSSVKRMSEKNKKEYTGSRDGIISDGYEPCKICNP